MDGTSIDAWASMGGYRRTKDDEKPPTGPPNLKGETRRSDTRECKPDPDARLYKKALRQAACLCYIGHMLAENRHALVVDSETAVAGGTAEVDAALTMLDRRPGKRRLTVAADKNYDQKRFVAGARAAHVTPHVAQHTNGRRTTIDARTTRHAGYAQSRNARHRVETPFGSGKYNRLLKQTMPRGLAKVGAEAELVFASFNLVRIAALEGA